MAKGLIAQQKPNKVPGTMTLGEMKDTFLKGMGMGFFGGIDPIGGAVGAGAEMAGAPPLAAAIGSIGIPDPGDAIRIAKLLKNLPSTLKKTGASLLHEPSSVGDFFNLQRGGSKVTAAVNPKDNVLDLLKIEGGGEGLEAFDELADFLGLQGRRGTTTMTKEGTESVSRAVEKGFSSPNPSGPGVLQTAQPEGLNALIDALFTKITGKQKGGIVPDVNELMHYLLNPPQGMTTMQGGGQINAGGSAKIRHGRGRTPDADRRGRSEANCSSARWGGWFNTLNYLIPPRV
ncbi:MAG: hypothetical protein ACYSW8_33345 [Planctomycetota bacterium]|jgi:hypothetical protein